MSALSRSFKLSWSDDLRAFVLDGETLNALLDRLVPRVSSARGGRGRLTPRPRARVALGYVGLAPDL